MATMKRDPNSPPDPNETVPIPTEQHPAGWDVNPHNPVAPAAAPPPVDELPPTEPPPDQPPPEEPPPEPVQTTKSSKGKK